MRRAGFAGTKAYKAERRKRLVKAVVTTVLLICVLSVAVRAGQYSVNFPGQDFYRVWVVDRAVIDFDAKGIYSVETFDAIKSEYPLKARARYLPNRWLAAAEEVVDYEALLTPFLHLALLPFASHDYERAINRYMAFSVICLLFGMALLSRLAGFGLNGTVVMLLFFMVFYEPFFADLRLGSTGSVQVALLSLFLFLQSRHTWRYRSLAAGTVLGLAVLFKPNLALVPLMVSILWLLSGRQRELAVMCAGMAAGAFLAVVSSGAFFGSTAIWSEWSAAVESMPSGVLAMEMGNISPIGMISEFIGFNLSWYFTAYLVLVVSAFLWIGRQRAARKLGEMEAEERRVEREFREDFLMVSAGTLIYLLSAPLVLIHYLLLAVPMFVFALRPDRIYNEPFGVGRLARILPPALALILLAAGPVAAVVYLNGAAGLTLVTALGTLLLFVLLIVEIFSSGFIAQPAGGGEGSDV